MENFAQIILQVLSVLDGLSVAYIIGAVTILVILEITREAHQELDKGTRITRHVLGLGILTQLVYRGVDFATTMSLVNNQDIQIGDLSSVYLISLIMTLAAVVAFAMQKRKKMQFQMFVFFQAALWYTMFVLSQFVARNPAISEMSGGSLSMTTIVAIIFILLVLDSTKRYYHKKVKK